MSGRRRDLLRQARLDELIDGPRRRRTIQRVEVNAGDVVLEKRQTLLRRVVHPDVPHRLRIVLNRFNPLQQVARDARAAHLREPLDLFDAENRHDAGDDGDVDTGRHCSIAKRQKVRVVEE